MAETSIEWTDATWNPVAGCSVVTAGCTNCYAINGPRLEAMGVQKCAGLTRKSGRRYVWSGNIKLDKSALEIPSRWQKPKMSSSIRCRTYSMRTCPLSFWPGMGGHGCRAPAHVSNSSPSGQTEWRGSCGPILSLVPSRTFGWARASKTRDRCIASTSYEAREPRSDLLSFEPLLGSVRSANLSGIDWAIVGGKSGPNARPMSVEWLNEIHAMCDRMGTAILFQAMGRPQQESERSILPRADLGQLARLEDIIRDSCGKSNCFSIRDWTSRRIKRT